MHRKCRERFLHYRLQRRPLVSNPGMHHGTCVTHVTWCMPGTLTHDGGGNVPGIPGACATRNFAYLVRGPWLYRCLPRKGVGKRLRFIMPRVYPFSMTFTAVGTINHEHHYSLYVLFSIMPLMTLCKNGIGRECNVLYITFWYAVMFSAMGPGRY